MKMKLKSLLLKPSGVNVAKDQVVSIKGQKNNKIRCLDGTVWVTWPPGKETTLQGGQSITVATAKKICIQAMSDAVVSVQSTGDVIFSNHAFQFLQQASFLRSLRKVFLSHLQIPILPL